MSKMTCMEAVYDVLAGRCAEKTEHECFDDLVMGCYAVASGESNEPDVPAWIAAHDRERSEMEVMRDICDYFLRYHGACVSSTVIDQAVAAGKAVL